MQWDQSKLLLQVLEKSLILFFQSLYRRQYDVWQFWKGTISLSVNDFQSKSAQILEEAKDSDANVHNVWLCQQLSISCKSWMMFHFWKNMKLQSRCCKPAITQPTWSLWGMISMNKYLTWHLKMLWCSKRWEIWSWMNSCLLFLDRVFICSGALCVKT